MRNLHDNNPDIEDSHSIELMTVKQILSTKKFINRINNIKVRELQLIEFKYKTYDLFQLQIGFPFLCRVISMSFV